MKKKKALVVCEPGVTFYVITEFSSVQTHVIFERTCLNSDQNLTSWQHILSCTAMSAYDDLWPYTSLRRSEQWNISKAGELKLNSPFLSYHRHLPFFCIPRRSLCSTNNLHLDSTVLLEGFCEKLYILSFTRCSVDTTAGRHGSLINRMYLCARDSQKNWWYWNLVWGIMCIVILVKNWVIICTCLAFKND